MPGKGPAYASIAIGGLLAWSAIFNKKVTQTIQDVVKGQKPVAGPGADLSLPSAPSGPGGGGGGGGNVPPSGPGETAFWTAVMASIGALPTKANLNSMHAWFHHEEPSWPPPCNNNPLNSKMGMPGSFPCHAAPQIQAYPTGAEGVAATAATLLNGNYPQIVALLRSGKGLCGSTAGGEFSTWSGGGYSEVC